MLRKILVPVALVAGLLVPATAGATTVTSTAGGVSAQLAYQGRAGDYHGLSLSIRRGSSTLYRAPVRADNCGDECWPAVGTGSRAISVTSLSSSASAPPDVVLNLYTGGANCCFETQVFAPTRAGSAYSLLAQHDFDTYGDLLRRIDGEPLFVTGDPTFDTTFTDFAASAQPLELLSLSGSRFVEVTRRYPTLVGADAARWLRAYTRLHGQDDVGVIAAWAADESLLGRSRQAFSFLDAQARAGQLRSAFGAADSGTRFVTRLRALLVRDGYLS